MTHDQLEEYINNFREHQREEVYKAILDSQILKRGQDNFKQRGGINFIQHISTGFQVLHEKPR
jgi:hypothetical protein